MVRTVFRKASHLELERHQAFEIIGEAIGDLLGEARREVDDELDLLRQDLAPLRASVGELDARHDAEIEKIRAKIASLREQHTAQRHAWLSVEKELARLRESMKETAQFARSVLTVLIRSEHAAAYGSSKELDSLRAEQRELRDTMIVIADRAERAGIDLSQVPLRDWPDDRG